jgi:formylglycine-generating enzyme required for sulfatase activity
VVSPETVNVNSEARVEVGSRPANAWGLYEMHGNVGEICRDLLSPQDRAPNNRVDPEGLHGRPEGGLLGGGVRLPHAVRGGSKAAGLVQARSAAVDQLDHDAARSDVGFRFILRAAFVTPPSA